MAIPKSTDRDRGLRGWTLAPGIVLWCSAGRLDGIGFATWEIYVSDVDPGTANTPEGDASNLVISRARAAELLLWFGAKASTEAPAATDPGCGCTNRELVLAYQDDGADVRYERCPDCHRHYAIRITECDPSVNGCRGWFHSNLGEAREGIERCDTCMAFPDDDIATVVHALHCNCGAGPDRASQECHGCRAALGDTRFAYNDRIYCEDCGRKQVGST